MKQCSLEICNNKHYGLGLYKKHYQRYKKYEDPYKVEKKISKQGPCKVRDCGKSRHARGYCPKHYGRLIRNGNPNTVQRIRNFKECIIESCNDKYRGLGYCNKHYEQFRLKNDPIFKISKTLRTRLRIALKNNQKQGSAIQDLGCSIPELKQHLEIKFKLGMNWNNHGKWHIDHVKPLSSFDLTNREQFLKACNYKNLQPLWANENLSKSSKVE